MKRLGPSNAIAVDARTGRISDVFYHNQMGKLPPDMHSVLCGRVPTAPADYVRTYAAGSHTEIYGVNQLLKARPGAPLSDVPVYTMDLYFGKNWASVKPPCPHCSHIFNGVHYIGD